MRVSWLSQCNRMSHAFSESVVRKPPVPGRASLFARTLGPIQYSLALLKISVLFEATAATYAFSITFAGVLACCDREHLISHCNLHHRFIYYPAVLTEAVGLLTLWRRRGESFLMMKIAHDSPINLLASFLDDVLIRTACVEVITFLLFQSNVRFGSQ